MRAVFGFVRKDLDFTDPKYCVKQIYDCYLFMRNERLKEHRKTKQITDVNHERNTNPFMNLKSPKE
jgi:hypothetical protein